MGPSHAARQTVRRLGRALAGLLAAHLAALVVVASLLPVALGPALTGVARALGGAEEHTCACGMKPGTCGCPECERERLGGVAPIPVDHATLGSCDDHGRAPLAAGIPPALLPPTLSVLASLPAGLLPPPLPETRTPFEPTPPPTPPPRSRAA